MPPIIQNKDRNNSQNIDLLCLNSGVIGGRLELARRQSDSKWSLEKKDEAEWSDLDDSVYTSAPSGSDDENDDDELVDYDELKGLCVADMKGTRVLLVRSYSYNSKRDVLQEVHPIRV